MTRVSPILTYVTFGTHIDVTHLMSGLSESVPARGLTLPASLGLDDYDDSVEPALVPCPFGVERGRGIKVLLVSVFRWDLRVKG